MFQKLQNKLKSMKPVHAYLITLVIILGLVCIAGGILAGYLYIQAALDGAYEAARGNFTIDIIP